MNKFLALVLLIASSASFAQTTSRVSLCYSACTFTGLRNAQDACRTAAQAFNSGSSEAVHMSASCYSDTPELNICGDVSPACQFRKVVLQKNVTILGITANALSSNLSASPIAVKPEIKKPNTPAKSIITVIGTLSKSQGSYCQASRFGYVVQGKITGRTGEASRFQGCLESVQMPVSGSLLEALLEGASQKNVVQMKWSISNDSEASDASSATLVSISDSAK